MKNISLQTAASAGYAVAYNIGPIFKHIIDRVQLYSGWSSFWSWRVHKQEKLLHLGHRKPVRIHWNADGPKTSHSSRMSKKW